MNLMCPQKCHTTFLCGILFFSCFLNLLNNNVAGRSRRYQSVSSRNEVCDIFEHVFGTTNSRRQCVEQIQVRN